MTLCVAWAVISEEVLVTFGCAKGGRLGLFFEGDDVPENVPVPSEVLKPTICMFMFFPHHTGDDTERMSSPTTRTQVETLIGEGKHVKSVSCGAAHTAAVASDGTLWICGRLIVRFS